jgi:hypothetical protein
MFALRPELAPLAPMRGRLLLAAALLVGLSQCPEVLQEEGRGPDEYSEALKQDYCIKEVLLLSEVLAEPELLRSEISQSDCDRAIDEEEGYFETWHIYADQTLTVVLDAESDFDNLMKLLLVEEHTEEAVTGKVIAQNDDRSADDSGARLSTTLEATENYLLRLSSFGDEETGGYSIEVTPTDSPPPPPSTGSVEVNVSSAGEPPDTFTVTLNGKKAKPVATNGTVTYTGIVTGDYVVALSGLGDCTVDGDNPQDVTVNENQTTPASFEVSCGVPECGDEPIDTPCGAGGVCDGEGNCVECNGPQQCDDGSECTDNSCDGNSCATAIVAGRRCDYMGGSQNGVCNEQGQCETPPPACDPNPCRADTGNDCTEEICNESDGSCSEINVTDGTSCQDAPGSGRCLSGSCVAWCVGVDCSDSYDCTVDQTCDPQNGACVGGAISRRARHVMMNPVATSAMPTATASSAPAPANAPTMSTSAPPQPALTSTAVNRTCPMVRRAAVVLAHARGACASKRRSAGANRARMPGTRDATPMRWPTRAAIGASCLRASRAASTRTSGATI